MKKIIVLALMLALSSCAGFQTQPQKIAATCAAATTSLQVVKIGVEEGKITIAQRDQVVAAGEKIRPICKNPNITLDELKQAAFDEAVTLIAYYAGVAK